LKKKRGDESASLRLFKKRKKGLKASTDNISLSDKGGKREEG